MGNNNILHRVPLGSCKPDANNTVTAEVAAISRGGGAVAMGLHISVNGDTWQVAGSTAYSTEDARTILRDMVQGGHYFGSCLTDPARKTLREGVQAKASEAVRVMYRTNVKAFEDRAAEAYNVAVTLAGAPAPAAGDPAELEKLRADLAAAKAEADKLRAAAAAPAPASDPVPADLQDLISRTVADALARLQAPAAPAPGVVRHFKFEEVKAVLLAGCAPWLAGEAGTGKSVLCEQLAEALGCEYYYSGAILDEYAGLKGFIDANGVKHGTEFTRALEAAKAGREVLFCMDEADGSTPEVLLVLNNLLAGGAVECMGEVYRMTDNLHIVACGNTLGRGGSSRYTRSIIDSATLDRFHAVTIDYDPAIELASAGGNSDISDFCHALREAGAALGLDLLVTYRGIKRLAKLCELAAVGPVEALRGGILRGLDPADVRALHRKVREVLPGNPWVDTLGKLAE